MKTVWRIKKQLLWDYCMVTLFVLTSGANIWVGTLSPAVTFMFFFILSFYNSIKCHRLKVKHNKSFLFVLFVNFWCLISLVANGRLQDNSMLGYMVCLTGAYFFINSYSFYRFRSLLTDVVFTICLCGIPVFLFNELSILPTINMTFSGTVYKTFGPYMLGWPSDFHRFAGIWHEPGACQIILNSTLWLYYDNIIHWKWQKGELKKLMVILIALLLTLSTGGYMCLMLLIGSCVINLKFKSKYKVFIYPLLLILAAVAVVLMFNSDVIQNKLFAEDESESKMARTADMLALWRMTTEYPILGCGVGSKLFWDLSYTYGNTACSSGILTYSASLGFPWLVMFLIFLYRGIRKLKIGKAVFFLMIAVILMQFNEKFIEYPITNMFIFNFYSYSKKYAFNA